MSRFEVDRTFVQDGYDVKVMVAQCCLHPSDVYEEGGMELYVRICNEECCWLDCMVVVSLEGVEIGFANTVGLAYVDYREIYKDGVVDDLVADAIAVAEANVAKLAKAFAAKANGGV